MKSLAKTRKRTRTQAGFAVNESLLVVIAIIAILIG
jgi:Tfp pilus assembly protein FimT